MKTSSTNGRSKRTTKTPDLMGALKNPTDKQKPAPTASQIADSIDKEIAELQHLADILRGKK